MFKNFKKEYLVLLIIIVGLSVYLLNRDDNKIGLDIPELTEVPKDTIKRISISNSKNSFEIKLEKKKWIVAPEGYPVMESKTSQMLELLAKTDISDLISKSKQFDKFGLGDKNRTLVRAFGDKGNLRELTVGNSAESGNRTFVKLKDDDMIYQARGRFKDSFDIKKGEIIDKKIFSFIKDDIVDIQIVKGEQTYHLTKIDPSEKKEEKKKDQKSESNDDKKASEKTKPAVEPKPKAEAKPFWVNMLDKSRKVNEKAIGSFLSDNASMDCDNYQGKKSDLKTDLILTIHLTDKTKRKYTLALHGEAGKQDNIVVTSSESPFAFKLSEHNLKSLNIDPLKLITEEKKEKAIKK